MEQLDREVLDWIASHTGSAALAAQLREPRVRRRDYMRTGFFLYFEADAGLPAVAADVRPVCPHIDTAETPDGAGCSLFLRNGRLHYLEVYARGGFLPPALTAYTLEPAR